MDVDEDRIVKRVLQKLSTKNGLEPLDMTQVVGFHTHNGIDSPQIDYKNITGKNINYNQINNTPAPLPSASGSWNFNGTFSSDLLSVAWTSGTLILLDGTTYTISSGSSNVSGLTYIYFDSNVSTTTLQTSTLEADAVGQGKILIGVAYPGIANPQSPGVTIFNDDFNSYSNGTVNGQGSWNTFSGTDTLFVESSLTYEGAKAVFLNGTSNLASKKVGSAVTDGQLTFYGRVHGTSPSCFFKLYEDGTSKRVAEVRFGGTGTLYPLRVDYFDGVSESILGSITVDTWFSVQFQWRSSDKKYRVRLNGGTWTNWVIIDGFTTAVDTVLLAMDSTSPDTIYLDTIQQNFFYENVTFQIFGGSGGILLNENNITNIGNFTQNTSGDGAPGSTPTYLGQIYVDTTHTKIYGSTGTSSSVDWTPLN